MSELQVLKIDETAILPELVGASFQIFATDNRLETVLRAGALESKAYWFHTGLQFKVPAGHVLKVYADHDLATLHHTRLAECVALVEPGDHKELVLKMVIDAGGKSFEPKTGMRIARAMLEQIVVPQLVEVKSFDAPAAAAEAVNGGAEDATGEKVPATSASKKVKG